MLDSFTFYGIMRKALIILASLILIFPRLDCQVFFKSEIYKETISVKGKYFNGSGGKGYWDIKLIDSLGRISIVKRYKKTQLLGITKSIYDKMNNEIMSINLYDINNPNIIDTSWVKIYEYSDNEIIKEITKFTNEDSTIIQLIENVNDSLYIYNEMSSYSNEKVEESRKYSTVHKIIKNKYGLMTKWTQKSEESERVIEFEYYSNKRLRRKTIKRIPEFYLNGVYTGGPGSDDQLWEYKYDKKGRVKILFTIVDNKKYKIAKYKYK